MEARNEAGVHMHIALQWTKAHVRIEGNEVADQLAKEGTDLDSPVEVGIPLAEFKNKIEALFFMRNRKISSASTREQNREIIL